MKHTIETRNQFIQLRAAGESLGTIGEKLNVAKSTLYDWEQDHEADIARLRRLQWEETEKAFGRRLEDELENLALRLIDWNEKLDDINLNQNHSIREILMVLRETNREYYRIRGILMGTLSRRNKSQPNKTERFAETPETNPRNTNDLQQSPAESFGSAESKIENPKSKIDVPSAVNSEPNKTERSTENAPTEPNKVNDLQRSAPKSFGSSAPVCEPNETDFDGSVVINSSDSAQDIVRKCLEADRLRQHKVQAQAGL
jgi:hypothetical protein